jgi:hypothetical protein
MIMAMFAVSPFLRAHAAAGWESLYIGTTGDAIEPKRYGGENMTVARAD